MRIYIRELVKDTHILKEGAFWGRKAGKEFRSLYASYIEHYEDEVILLNFDDIRLIEMTFAIEALVWLAQQPILGKTLILEGVSADSRLNIEAAIRVSDNHRYTNLVLPIYQNGQVSFIGRLQPHLREFWEQIQGQACLQAPALAQRLGKTTGRINDNLRVFHHLGVLTMKVEKGIKTYSHLSFEVSAESKELEGVSGSVDSIESVEESYTGEDSRGSIESVGSAEPIPILVATSEPVTEQEQNPLQPADSPEYK